MNIWRVKSKTGKTIHLTYDREKTLCGRTIGDDWSFLYLLKDKTEALEHIDDLCIRCNDANLKEWEKESGYDQDDSEREVIESREEEPEATTTIVSKLERVDESEVKSVRSDRFIGLGTWKN